MSSAARFDVPSKLPRPLTPLVGRERHVDAVCTLLRRPELRLATLSGPGGIGKTRLALAVAERMQAELSDGAVFVALQSVSDPRLVVSTIAQALGVREAGGQTLLNSVRAALEPRHLLLVLDNFEQILPAAPLIADLLAACSNLTVLVTSRAVLHLYGEHDYHVPPLDLPDLNRLPPLEQLAEFEAIQLFVERAHAVNPAFELTAANVPVVAAICARVDSLPLAIELAAARIRMLSPAALLARLERQLTVLAGGPRDVPARQQTMRDTIAWSYDLLPAGERRLLRQLAVFAGGWTLDAADAVCGDEVDVFDGLSTLVDHSLVRQYQQPDGSSRFRLLETIREFGLSQLESEGESEHVRDRHAGYHAMLASEAATRLTTDLQGEWLNRIDDELHNLRAALNWLHIRGAAEQGMQIVANLCEFWFARGYLSEGVAQTEAFLALPSVTPRSATRGRLLAAAGWIASWLDDQERAAAYCAEARDILRERGDVAGLAFAFLASGMTARRIANLSDARTYWEQSLALSRELGDAHVQASSLNNLAGLAVDRGADVEALSMYQEALEVARRSGDSGSIALILNRLARLAQRAREYDRATDFYRDALTLYGDLNWKSMIPESLEGLAVVSEAQGNVSRAIRLFAASNALRVQIGVPAQAIFQVDNEPAIAAARAVLGDVAFQALWNAGSMMTVEDVITEALSFEAPPKPPASNTPAPATASHPLSPRELDVLRGIVDGKSNHEIASALFISPNTVTNHVANIMNKLGLDSRTAVATWAVRNGIE